MLEIYDKRNNTGNKEMKIGAVIVLYEPILNMLTKTLDALMPQVDMVCMVDNSNTDNSLWFASLPSILYIPLKKNIGIAAAQNLGIKELMRQGCSHILFSDQDSVMAENTVKQLYSAICDLQEKGISIATVGTAAINSRTGKRYPSRAIHKGMLEKNGRLYEEVDYVRCSVSLTPVISLKAVGGMEEPLFIDGVDSEWCWRAAKHQLRTFIVDDAVIYHNLGLKDKKIGNKDITIPSSFRMYYQYRNYFKLISREYVPIRWKIKNGFKYLFKIPYYSLICTNRKQNFQQLCKGIKDGINKPIY